MQSDSSSDTITTIEDVPIIDLEQYMNSQDQEGDPAVLDLCHKLVDSLHRYGILIVKDPRAHQQDNAEYIDLMEEYFESRGNQLYSGQELEDAKPEHHYQVGVCPEMQEKARKHDRRIRRYTAENKPISPIEPVFDAKWRFMWKIGERPAESTDNFPQVVPKDFPQWTEKMDKWGYKLLNAVNTVAEMSAIGMGLPKNTFVEMMDGGAHLLAPTGSDLKKNDVGAIFAGFHYDIAFLTIHGKSRYPGLFVWLRNNQKLQVKIPDGCLLLQSGKTFEHITGGYVLPGFHEVVYTEKTKEAYEKAVNEGRRTWRVSSTMFTHFRYNVDCSPLPALKAMHRENAALKYPKMSSFDLLMTELSATNMVLEASDFSAAPIQDVELDEKDLPMCTEPAQLKV